MHKMKVLAALGMALLAGCVLTTPVVADGMPAARKAKAVEVDERPAIGNWSGLYFGVNAGVAWSDIKQDFRTYDPEVYGFHNVKNDDSNGLLGGHIGLQHQWGRFVVGVEASYSGVGPFGHDWEGGDCNDGKGGACQSRLNSLFTVGPRLGLAHDNLMFYVTGGYASAQIQTRYVNLQYDREYFAASARHDGWFIGGGAEWAIHDRWVLGLEYLHVNLDSEQHWSKDGAPEVGITRSVDGDIDIVRARLSFKLGRGEHHAEPMK